MALVAFLRGVNVGGHKAFRPTLLAKELRAFDVVNVGAAGTFVVRKPGSKTKFRAALLKKLPFETAVALCDARDLLRLVDEQPFGKEPASPDVTRFVSVLMKAERSRPSLPMTLPESGEWLVRIIAARDQFILGEYRRNMKTISYLGQLDKRYGSRATTRNWNTIMALVRILRGKETTV